METVTNSGAPSVATVFLGTKKEFWDILNEEIDKNQNLVKILKKAEDLAGRARVYEKIESVIQENKNAYLDAALRTADLYGKIDRECLTSELMAEGIKMMKTTNHALWQSQISVVQKIYDETTSLFQRGLRREAKELLGMLGVSPIREENMKPKASRGLTIGLGGN